MNGPSLRTGMSIETKGNLFKRLLSSPISAGARPSRLEEFISSILSIFEEPSAKPSIAFHAKERARYLKESPAGYFRIDPVPAVTHNVRVLGSCSNSQPSEIERRGVGIVDACSRSAKHF